MSDETANSLPAASEAPSCYRGSFMSDSSRDLGQNTDDAIHRRKLLANVDKYRDIAQMDDGFQYFWMKDRGAFSANDLRIIADELDRRNRDWQKQVEGDLSR